MSTATARREPREVSTAQELPPEERARLERAFTVPRTRFLLGIPVAVLLLIWSFNGAQFNFAKLGEGSVNMVEFIGRLFPPDLSRIDTILALLLETFQMAVVGTVLGAVLSLFAAFAASSNIAPRWL